MKILVIGGSGFVSGTLARTALAEGHSVWTVTRGEKPLPEGVTAVTADRHDRPAFEAAVARCGTTWDLVVDCIGYAPEDAAQDLVVFRERAVHLVFISTDFVFDPARRAFPQPVDAPCTTEEDYGGKKRRCELTLLEAETGVMACSIVRPCHIYGPGSLLGCLPLHGRDPELLAKLSAGTPLQLVGGGHFLQQPIFAADLAHLVLSCAGNTETYGHVLPAAGPDVIESCRYYEIIAGVLGVGLSVEEVSVEGYAGEFPGKRPFLCHRIYDLSALEACGIAVPATPIEDGLREHVASLQGRVS
jgi:nucleoside-diphosphate-sugar epimerase